MLQINNLHAAVAGIPILKGLTLTMLSFTGLVATPVAAKDTPQIPAAYHGEWRMTMKECGSHEAAKREIDQYSMTGFEEGAEILSVDLIGKGKARVAALWKYSGEDEKERVVHTLTLKKSGQILIEIIENGARQKWRKCPSVKK
jgi:hypothetical protein